MQPTSKTKRAKNGKPKTEILPLGDLLIKSDISHSIVDFLTWESKCAMRLVCRESKQLIDASVQRVCEPKASPTNLAALVKANWPGLKHLTIGYTELQDPDIQILAQGNWPHLETCIFVIRDATGFSAQAFNKANWPKLKELRFQGPRNLYNCSMGHFQNGFMRTFIEESPFTNLRKLILHDMRDSDRGKEFKPESCSWPIEELELTHDICVHTNLEMVLQLPFLSKLCSLSFKLTYLQEGGVKAIVQQASLFTSLKKLSLVQCSLEDKGGLELAKAKFPCLASLNISENRLKAESLIPIIRAFGPTLDELYLNENSVNEAVASELIVPAVCDRLKLLSLMHCKLLNPLVSQVLAQGSWVRLETLYFTGYLNLGTGERALLKGKGWSNLRRLYIAQVGMTPRDLAVFTSQPWPFLEELDLSVNPELGNKGALILIDAHLPELKVLRALNCGFEEDGIAAVKKKWGKQLQTFWH